MIKGWGSIKPEPGPGPSGGGEGGWGIRRLRDWSLALLLIAGFVFGGTGPVKAAAMCYPIDKWGAHFKEHVKQTMETPFIWLRNSSTYMVVFADPATNSWTLVTLHRSVNDGPLIGFCIRGVAYASDVMAGFGVGELPPEIQALTLGDGA